MRLHRNFYYKKSIIVTENNMRNLHKLLVDNFEIVSYSARLKDKSSISFESIDEIFLLDNEKNSRIELLTINARKETPYASLEINLGDIDFSFFFRYKHTISCNLNTDDRDFDILIKEKLLKCFDSMGSWFWWINKISFITTIPFAIFFLSTLVSATMFLFGKDFFVVDNSSVVNINLAIFSLCSWFALSFGLTYGLSWLFPIKQFNIGNEIVRYKTIVEKARGVIFGAVILAIVIGVIVNKIS